MRTILAATLTSAAIVLPVASAQEAVSPQPVLHCYGARTQVNTAARREFLDANGLLVKEIYYTSDEETDRPSCAEHTLKPQSIRTYHHDSAGRVLVERQLHPNGEVEGVWRFEYVADDRRPSRRVWFNSQGGRQYEIRYRDGLEASHIYFDERGGIAGVSGHVPDDLAPMLAWGGEGNGWRCGIAVAPKADGDRYPRINVHLLNNSDSETGARLVDWFETELRDGRGARVPLSKEYVAESALVPRNSGSGRLLRPGEADFTSLPLDRRYGVLAAGRYTLLVRHPHPETGETLVSNTIAVTIGAAR